MHIHRIGRFAAAEVQHGRPKKRVEISDVFANEMVLFYIWVVDVSVVVHTDLAQVIFERSQVTNGRIEPYVEIFAGRIGNFNAEIRRIAADVPIAQAALAFFVFSKPFFDFVQHLGLQAASVVRPFFKKLNAARVGQFEEVMLGLFEDRRGARQSGVGVLHFGGGIHRTA